MTEDINDSGLRPGVERRLEFIEYRLYWEGGVNRADITEKFGVSQPQASNDLTLYQRLAPENLRYDTSLKRYLPAAGFRPIFLKPNAAQYLVEQKSLAEHVLSPADSWSGEAPPVGVMPVPGRRVKPEILQSLLRAIRAGRALRVHYHSMSEERPDAIWRWITPHALGCDGLRWHVRAYCHVRERFLDFVLSRFLETAEFGDPGALPVSDVDWNSFFEVVLKPNPKLGPAKMRTVALDYEMVDGKLVLSVRRALLYYLDKRLRLDVGEKLDKPHETPIVVANRAEFEKAIKEATGAVVPVEGEQ
ncbi:MAG: WYL domain-containing protein [Pseudomonadota bacterium]